VLYGSDGQLAQLFDIPAQWRARCADVTDASLPGGHFFVDQFANETVTNLKGFLAKC
jgi:haloacetate dehalogenase